MYYLANGMGATRQVPYNRAAAPTGFWLKVIDYRLLVCSSGSQAILGGQAASSKFQVSSSMFQVSIHLKPETRHLKPDT